MTKRNFTIILSTLLTICMLSTCKKDEPKLAELVSISIKVPPSKVDFFDGEKLDLSGLLIVMTMNDGTNSEVKLSDFDSNSITCYPANGTILPQGTHIVVFSHTESDISANISVSVKKVIVSSIEIETPPEKLEYFEGETLELEGLTISLIMNNGEQEQIAYEDFASNNISCLPINKSKLYAENEYITITHQNTGIAKSQAIKVKAIELSSISIKSPPETIEYFDGDILSLDGLVITLEMNNGRTEDVLYQDFSENKISCAPENGSTLNMDSRNVTIKHTNSKAEVKQEIVIKEVLPISIEVTNLPLKVIYSIGESLDLSGLIVTINKNNSTEEDIPFLNFEEKGIVCSPSSGTLLDSELNVISISCVDSKTSFNISLNEVISDIEGNLYHTVKIGEQTWMAENLRTTKYRNGEKIGTTTPATLDISGESEPKYQWPYNGDESEITNSGRLYTWYAVSDNRKVCPIGWHVPTDEEWSLLQNYLKLNGYNCETPEIYDHYGVSLASLSGWDKNTSSGAKGIVGSSDCIEKRNSTGFTAFPSGLRYSSGVFLAKGKQGSWWASPVTSNSHPWLRYLSYNDPGLTRGSLPESNGLSIRCIKD